MSRGEWLKVISPDWLALDLQNWLQAAINRYKNEEIKPNGDESGNGTDDFGFYALPAGYGNVPGGFTYEGYDANIWSYTENGDFNSYGMHVYCNYDNAVMGFNGRFYVFSVRCLKDDP